jgi:hypothetical protein
VSDISAHENTKATSYILSWRSKPWEGGNSMIRFVVIALIVLAVWVLLLNILRLLKGANIDWTGIATMVGFVVLAFYLRHLTGMG